MARGDYYDVWLRDETQPRRVQATRVGATVAIDMGEAVTIGTGSSAVSKPASQFIAVTELDKADAPIRVFQFARERIDCIEQGHAPIKQGKK